MSGVFPILGALRQAVGYREQSAPLGNVSVGRGEVGGRPVRVALVENRAASGAIGPAETERLVALFKVVALERTPLVLYLDSAGARVSEGLRVLGAFRALVRAGVQAVRGGVPVAAVLGSHCFGGASMLAHLAARRLFQPDTRLAMSGPAILAAAAGVPATDEAFRAMADAALSAAARAAASSANRTWNPGEDLSPWLAEACVAPADPVAALRLRHETLAPRLERRAPDAPWQPVTRRDLDRLYPAGYAARESQGLLRGQGERETGPEAFLGFVGKAPVGAARAWRFAELAWEFLERPPERLEVFLDCATHAPRLDDEKVVLTEFVMDMSFALAALAARGTRVGLTVLGDAGGSVYAALAAPARRVASVHGAQIRVLPGAAVFAILGENRESVPAFDEYRRAGVADEEIRLGIVPTIP